LELKARHVTKKSRGFLEIYGQANLVIKSIAIFKCIYLLIICIYYI
jgi:hypothetical protein